MQFVLPYESEVVVAAGFIAVLGFVFGLIALASSTRQKRNVKKWKSIHATADLEEVYARTLDEVDRLKGDIESLENQVTQLRRELRKKISTARVQRYNAFAETGSDLSFSVALLDDEANGVVVSSIYGREESRTYAKPILDGKSNYTLTEEEEQVISQSTGKVPVHGRAR